MPMAPSTAVVLEPAAVVDTGLFGRESLLASLCADIHNGTRWIVLRGPAGVGKTALARALTARLLADRTHTEFIPLIGAQSLAEASIAVSCALGIVQGQAPSLGSALASLGPTVLVFDNAEHLPGFTYLVGRWLDEAPKLQVVITSQADMNDVRVSRTDIPPLDAVAARALLVDRVQEEAREAFGEDDTNSALVERLTESLGGIPLAIEVAAACIRIRPLPDLIDHLDDPLRLLRDRDQRDPQHRALAAALDWSWRHLSENDRTLLVSLSVFRGRVPLDAIAAVFGIDSVEAGHRTEALRARSLCSVTSDGVVLFEAVRTLVRDEGAHSYPNALSNARDQHLRWALSLVQDALVQHEGPWPQPALDTLTVRLPEIAAAAEHAEHTDRCAFGWLALARDGVYRSYSTPSAREALLDAALAKPPSDRSLEAQLRMARALAKPSAHPSLGQALVKV